MWTGCSPSTAIVSPADRERRLERHRLRPAGSSAGAKSPCGRGADPRRCRAAGAASPHRREAGRRSRTSRLRRALGPQDVRAVRHRRAGRVAATRSCSGAPEHQGGGTVDVVTPTEVYWAGLPDREEAGSPNVIGAVAMAVAAQTLIDAGMDGVARHEASLTAYALDRCGRCPGSPSTARGIRRDRTIASVSSPSTSDRCLTRWLPPSSATRRGSACGAAVSARNPTSRTCWAARQDAGPLAARGPRGAARRKAGHGPAQSRDLQHA